MALQDFQNRIIDLLGEGLAGDVSYDTAMFDDWTTQGARDVISRMPKGLYDRFILESAAFDSATGISINTAKVHRVLRSDGDYEYPCRMIDVGMRGRVANPDDFSYAIDIDPAAYVDVNSTGEKTVKVFPASGSSNARAFYVAHPSVDADTDNSIAGFPDELEHLVVYYGAVMAKMREAGVMRRASQDELEAITTTGYLSDFEGALPTYSSPTSVTLPTLSLAQMGRLPQFASDASALDTNTVSTSDATPTNIYTKGTESDKSYIFSASIVGISDDGSERYGAVKTATFYNDGGSLSQLGYTTSEHEEESSTGLDFSFSTSGTTVLLQVTGLAATSMTWSATINYSPGDAVESDLVFVPTTMTALPGLSLSSMTSLPTLTLSSMTALPTYSAQSIGAAIGTLSITNKTLTDPGTLSLPTAITLPTLAIKSAPVFSDLDLSGISAPSATLSYTTAGSQPTSSISPTQSIPTFTAPSGFNLQTTDIDDALLKAQNIVDAGASVGGDSAAAGLSVQTGIGNEDIELAQTSLGLARQEVERANATLASQRVQLSEYEAELQEALGQFNAEIKDYSAEVDKEYRDARANIESYSAFAEDKRADLEEQVAQYQGDIQSYREQINSAVQEWRSEEIDFKLQKWQTEAQNDINEYRVKVQALVEEYRAESEAAISEYRANVERQIQEFRAEMEADTAEWTEQKKVDLAKYEADINQELGQYQAKVRAYIGEYSAKIESEIQEYSALANSYIKEFVAKTDVELKEYTAKVGAYVEEFSANVQATIQEYNARVNAILSEYREKNTVKLSEYSNKANAKLNKYAQEVQEGVQGFGVDLNKARSYLEEAGVRLQTMQGFNVKSQSALAESEKFYNMYESGITNYIKMEMAQ